MSNPDFDETDDFKLGALISTWLKVSSTIKGFTLSSTNLSSTFKDWWYSFLLDWISNLVSKLRLCPCSELSYSVSWTLTPLKDLSLISLSISLMDESFIDWPALRPELYFRLDTLKIDSYWDSSDFTFFALRSSKVLRSSSFCFSSSSYCFLIYWFPSSRWLILEIVSLL